MFSGLQETSLQQTCNALEFTWSKTCFYIFKYIYFNLSHKTISVWQKKVCTLPLLGPCTWSTFARAAWLCRPSRAAHLFHPCMQQSLGLERLLAKKIKAIRLKTETKSAYKKKKKKSSALDADTGEILHLSTHPLLNFALTPRCDNDVQQQDRH